MTHTLDKLVRIYNDGTGSYIQIAPCEDGLEGLWDIKLVDGENKSYYHTITINREEAELLIKAIQLIILDQNKA